MYSKGQFQRLYDIPSLPDSLLKQKYESTPDPYDDPNTVENFMRETIRGTGPDAPLFESDMPRQSSRNPFGQSLMNMQEHGKRYTHDPYHPELFLGDLTKDQRMSTNDPRVSQINDQTKFRQERYIYGKLQDVADVRTEGIVGEKRMLKQVKEGYNDTATRLGGIFNDSTDGMNTKSSAHPGRTMLQVGDVIKEDQKVYENGGEKILPQYGTDIVGKLSNMIGVQWNVQPESKFGLSSVSNVYRSKQEVDRAANAVFRLGQQDTKFKDGKSGFKNGTHVFQVSDLKAARNNAQNVAVDMKKDSMRNRFISALLPPSVPINHVDRMVGTQPTKRQIATKGIYYKYTPGNNIQESLVEPIKPVTDDNIVVNHAIMPPRDVGAILYRVSHDNKQKMPETTQTSSSMFSAKTLAKAFTTRKDGMQSKRRQYEYADNPAHLGLPSKPVDHVERVAMTKSKFAGTKEHILANPTGTTTLPSIKQPDDFRYDTDPTMNNNYQTRRGSRQSNGVRLTALQDIDSTISPVNDTVVPFRTNYAK